MSPARVPEPTARDLAAWRRLVAAMAAAAQAPREPCGDLAVACSVARTAVVAEGPPTAQHPLIRLHRLAERFNAETRAGREALSADCLAAVEAARPLLTRADQPKPPIPAREPRRRADIDD